MWLDSEHRSSLTEFLPVVINLNYGLPKKKNQLNSFLFYLRSQQQGNQSEKGGQGWKLSCGSFEHSR